ncbi:MAG: YceI family protein, partial [Pseudomonadota bacterium]
VVGIAAWIQPVETRAEVASLDAVASEWAVQDGSISITVRQFGSDVTGTFSDWTSDISYDPDAAGDQKGTVATTINIGSLTLGSVTNQALGPDFFDLEGFPTATFDAILVDRDGQLTADGTLTIKGASVPLAFPVFLALDGDTATVTAQTQVNRMDFNVGTSQPDESSLGFAVGIDIALTAQRGA